MNNGLKIITGVSAGVAVMVIINEAVKGQEKIPVGHVDISSPTQILNSLHEPVNFNPDKIIGEVSEPFNFNFDFDFVNGFNGFDLSNIDFSIGDFGSVNNYDKPETKFDRLISKVETANGIPRDLLHRLLYQESRFRDDIIYGQTQSSAGALGIAQLIPRYHPDPRIYSGEVNPLIPEQAIPYAGKYLKFLKNRFGDWGYALAAYNWGETVLNKNLDKPLTAYPVETQNYVKNILSDVNIQSVLV